MYTALIAIQRPERVVLILSGINYRKFYQIVPQCGSWVCGLSWLRRRNASFVYISFRATLCSTMNLIREADHVQKASMQCTACTSIPRFYNWSAKTICCMTFDINRNRLSARAGNHPMSNKIVRYKLCLKKANVPQLLSELCKNGQSCH